MLDMLPPTLEDGWWIIKVDSTECRTDLVSDKIFEIVSWQYQTCEGKRPFDYRYAKHSNYFAFRNREDALLCYLTFVGA